MEQLTAAVRAKLEPAEAAFLDEVGPLRIKSVVLEGTQCIEVLLFGQETLIEWDGTEADAVQIVSDHAESHAAASGATTGRQVGGNVLVDSQGGVSIIDFGSCLATHPAFDAASLSVLGPEIYHAAAVEYPARFSRWTRGCHTGNVSASGRSPRRTSGGCHLREGALRAVSLGRTEVTGDDGGGGAVLPYEPVPTSS